MLEGGMVELLDGDVLDGIGRDAEKTGLGVGPIVLVDIILDDGREKFCC